MSGLTLKVLTLKVLQREKEFSLQQQQQKLQQINVVLEKNQAEIKLQYDQLAIEFKEAEKAKNEHKQTSLHWQKQYSDLQKVCEEKINVLVNTQAEAQLLAQKLIAAEESLINLKDQNKLLDHERWVIAEEKAQLEGQLKQLQKMSAF